MTSSLPRRVPGTALCPRQNSAATAARDAQFALFALGVLLPVNPKRAEGRRAVPEPPAHGAVGLLDEARPVQQSHAVVTAPQELPAVRIIRPATLFLPYEPESARDARHLVHDKLREWELDDLVDDAQVIVSELVTNAVRHTGCHGRMAVTLRRRTADTVRLGVRDGSRSVPCVIAAGERAVGGLGMVLVGDLAKGRWGVDVEPYGKTVFADLTASQP